MDLNQLMKLAQDPNVQNLIKNLLGRFTGGGGQANLQGLVSQLEQNGLGDQVHSWLQQGPNQPVTGAQIQQALGTSTLDQLASESNLAPETAAEDLAQVLPEIMNQASPKGALPESMPQLNIDDLVKQLMGGLTQPK